MGKTDIAEKKGSILIELHSKLEKNLKKSIDSQSELFERVEIKARSFTVVSSILKEDYHCRPHQQEILTVFDELFADVIISIYLAGCSLDNPAQSLLRRVIELGVGTVYLWDLPHRFWGWKECGIDLSFNEMLSHINSIEYSTLVSKENPAYKQGALIDQKKVNEIYGSLSDTVHGKICTFETVLPDRYDFNPDDWTQHLKKTEEIQNVLLNLWRKRFLQIDKKLHSKCPQLQRFK